MGSTVGKDLELSEVTEEALKPSTEQLPAHSGFYIELGFDDILFVW